MESAPEKTTMNRALIEREWAGFLSVKGDETRTEMEGLKRITVGNQVVLSGGKVANKKNVDENIYRDRYRWKWRQVERKVKKQQLSTTFNK